MWRIARSILILVMAMVLGASMAAAQSARAGKSLEFDQKTPQATAKTFYTLMGQGRFEHAARLLPDKQRVPFLEGLPLKESNQGKLMMTIFSSYQRLENVVIKDDTATGTPVMRFKGKERPYVPQRFVKKDGRWYIIRF